MAGFEARAYGTHALLLKDGQAVAFGWAEGVFSTENLERTFSVDVSAWMRSLLKQWEKERACEKTKVFSCVLFTCAPSGARF